MTKPMPNREPVHVRLNDARNTCLKHGLKPSRVYLGIEEHTELTALAREFRADSYGVGLTWNGLPVFKVDARSHLAVATEAPDSSPCG